MKVSLWRVLGLLACLPTVLALANPTGPAVAHGQADFSLVDPRVLEITNTPGTVINWQSFSIGAGEITRFLQQGASSAVLNRVIGSDLSSILGRLESNGQVFLVNPNGIFFGPGSVVDTAGLVASTLNLSDEDFLAGNYRFLGDEAGGITNQGTLRSAGDILLLGADVRNEGAIHSDGGSILLAAGESVRALDPELLEVDFEIQAPENSALNLGEIISDGGAVGLFAGHIGQSGVVSADAVTVDDAGRVVLHAADTTLVDGEISASSGQGGGGEIELLGHNVGLMAGALVRADGASGGGSVHVGGSREGAGPLPNANAVYIDAAATVSADATVDGDGGTVIAYADDTARIHGQVSARGAGDGAGGFVETSGKRSLDIGVTPDVSAPSGDGGEWLIDPFNLVITTGTTNTTTSPSANVFESNQSPFSEIGVDLIEQAMTGGVTVILQTGAGGSDPGDMQWVSTAELDLSQTTGLNTLELRAHGSIQIDDGGIGFLGVASGQELTFRTYPNFFSGGGGTVTAKGTFDFGTDGSGFPGGWDATSVGANDNLVRFSGDTNITGTFAADTLRFLNAPDVTLSRGGIVDTFIFDAGTYDNPIGTLTVNEQLTWSGGTILGDVRSNSAATVTINPGGTKIIDGGFFWSQSSNGLAAWDPAGGSDTITLRNGGDIEFSGEIDIHGGATIATDGNTDNQFRNRGTINILSQGLDPVRFQPDYIDTFAAAVMAVDGEVILENGRLTSFGSGHATTFQLLSGGTSATIRFRNGHTFDTFDSGFVNIDTVIFEDSSSSIPFSPAGFDVTNLSVIGNSNVVLQDDYTFDALRLEQFGGNDPTLDRRGAITVNNTFVWDAGVIKGSGSLDATGVTGLTLSVAGDRELSGGTLSLDSLSLDGGTLTVSDAALSITNDFSLAAGTQFLASAGLADVDVGGTFGVAGMADLNGGTFDTALLDVDATGTLGVDGATATVTDQATDTNMDGTLNMFSGTLTLGHELIIGSGATFNMVGGTFGFPVGGPSERLFVDGLMTFRGGTINAPGGFAARNGGVIELSSASNTFLDSTHGQLSASSNGTIRKLADGTGTTTLGMRVGVSQNGTLELLGGLLDASESGIFQQQSTSLTKLQGGNLTVGTIADSAHFRVTGGQVLGGTSTLTGEILLDGGSLGPGLSAGQLDLVGALVMTGNGILDIELGGTAQGTAYDWIDITGTASLAGTLNASLINSFAPSNGDSFQFLTATGGVTGSFATLNLPANFTATVNANEVLLDFNSALNLNLWNGGASNFLWEDPANWDLGTPDADDDVRINFGGITVVHGTGTDTIRTLGIDATSTLDLSGGSLTVTNASTLDGTLELSGGTAVFDAATSLADLLLSGGILSGAGVVTVLDSFLWQDGTLTGAGELVIAGGNTNAADDALLDIDPLGFASLDLFLDGRTITNESFNPGNTFEASKVFFRNSAVFNNDGFLLTKDSAFFGDNTDPVNNADGTFANTGTLEAQGGLSNRTEFYVPVTNTGTFRVTSGGEMQMWAGATSTAGTFQLDSGATFRARCQVCPAVTYPYDFTGTAVTGAGILSIGVDSGLSFAGSTLDAFRINPTVRSNLLLGGTVTVDEIIAAGSNDLVVTGDVTVTDRFNLNNGSLDFSAGSLDFTGSEFLLTFGATLTGGALNLPAGTEATLIASTLDGVQLTNSSLNTLSELRGTITLSNGASITNDGWLGADAQVRLIGDGSLINNGTLSFDDSLTGTGAYTVETDFAQNGTLLLADSGGGGAQVNFSGDLTLAGTLDLGAGVTAIIDSASTQQVLGGSTITGSGLLRLNTTLELLAGAGGNATTALTPDILNNGVFRVSSGNVDISGAAIDGAGTGDWEFLGGNVTLGTLVINSGTIPLSTTLNGNLDLSGGNATLAPGSSPGIAVITGDLILGPASNLAIEIFGLTPGSNYDQIQVQNLTLDGTATFNFNQPPLFSPTASDFFHFLTYTGTLTDNGLLTSGAGSGALFNTSNSIALSFTGSTPAPFVFPASGVAGGAQPPTGAATGPVLVTLFDPSLESSDQNTSPDTNTSPFGGSTSSGDGSAGSSEEEGDGPEGEQASGGSLTGSGGAGGELQMCM